MNENAIHRPPFKGRIRQTKNKANYVTIPKQYVDDGHYIVNNIEYRWFAISEGEYQRLKKEEKEVRLE